MSCRARQWKIKRAHARAVRLACWTNRRLFGGAARECQRGLRGIAVAVARAERGGGRDREGGDAAFLATRGITERATHGGASGSFRAPCGPVFEFAHCSSLLCLLAGERAAKAPLPTQRSCADQPGFRSPWDPACHILPRRRLRASRRAPL